MNIQGTPVLSLYVLWRKFYSKCKTYIATFIVTSTLKNAIDLQSMGFLNFARCLHRQVSNKSRELYEWTRPHCNSIGGTYFCVVVMSAQSHIFRVQLGWKTKEKGRGLHNERLIQLVSHFFPLRLCAWGSQWYQGWSWLQHIVYICSLNMYFKRSTSFAIPW